MNPLNIYQRMNLVMKDLKYIQKGEKKVNNQYNYVSHDAVSSALHDPLTKNGIAVIPSVIEMVQDGNRTTAKVEVSFVNIDDPKDRVSVLYVGYGIDAGDKGPGKAISYACKYALLKTFCLETGDDPDHDQKLKYEPSKPKCITTYQWLEINNLIDQCDESFSKTVKNRLSNLGVKSEEDMQEDLFTKIKKACLHHLEKKVENATC